MSTEASLRCPSLKNVFFLSLCPPQMQILFSLQPVDQELFWLTVIDGSLTLLTFICAKFVTSEMFSRFSTNKGSCPCTSLKSWSQTDLAEARLTTLQIPKLIFVLIFFTSLFKYFYSEKQKKTLWFLPHFCHEVQPSCGN